MVCIYNPVIVMCPCTLLVAYYVEFHWENVDATVIYIYDMYMQM